MKPIFSGGSSSRDVTSTGRRPASRARSAVREARFAERTDAKVAAASTSVPPAVASAEIVVQSAIERILRAGAAGPTRVRAPTLREDHGIATIDLTAPANDADPHSLFHELRARRGCPLERRAPRVAGGVASRQSATASEIRGCRRTAYRASSVRLPADPPGFAAVVDLLRGWMVFHDPPTHDRLRDPVRRAFTPMQLERIAPMIEATVDDLLDTRRRTQAAATCARCSPRRFPRW